VTQQAEQPGLRARKKAKTRAVIREQAIRLFAERGYQATTVEQIAEAAEVSPSTFFRYFPTKEDVVLQDDVDLITIEALEAQPPGLGPVAAFRAAVQQTVSRLSPAELAVLNETAALTLTVPEIRARALDEFIRTIGLIGAALARRAGRPADDFAAQNTAAAVIGVVMAAALNPDPVPDGPAQPGGAESPVLAPDWLARFDVALAHLEAGLPLRDWPG
jgi:AcrR family transcriptional regulator